MDIIYIAAIIVLFGSTAGLVLGCAKLRDAPAEHVQQREQSQ